MRKLLLKIIANIAAFYCAAKLFPAIHLNNVETAVWAGLILAGVNMLIRPLLFLITLPINLITLGLFSLILNTWMVILTDHFLGGLLIPGFWLAFAIAVIVWACNMAIRALEA